MKALRQFSGRLLAGMIVATVSLLAESPVSAMELTLDRPGDREFVRDLANMIDPADEEAIRQTCDKLLSEKATPIIVVTIESMAKHGGANLRIETFATLLFDQWQIGLAKLGEHNWNTGILLLISRDDRKARIELGAGWGHTEDKLCQKIMDEQIIPQFKAGQFSTGIVAGVTSLDRMGRKLELPRVPRPWTHYALAIGFVALAVFTAVSLFRRGASGWAWLFWGVVFSVVGTILYSMLTSSGNSSGGYSGGSFGGGFSGGGGASGSW